MVSGTTSADMRALVWLKHVSHTASPTTLAARYFLPPLLALMTRRGLLELAVITTFGCGSSLVCERGRSISSPAADVWDGWIALKRGPARRHAVLLFEIIDVVWQTRLMLSLVAACNREIGCTGARLRDCRHQPTQRLPTSLPVLQSAITNLLKRHQPLLLWNKESGP